MRNIKLILPVLFVFLAINIFAQNKFPEIEWEKKIKIEGDNLTYDITQTGDGNFLLVYTVENRKNTNSWILKLDTKGNKLWEKELELKEIAYVKSIIKAVDGGYIIAGYEKTAERSVYFDAFVAKLSNKGNILWKKNYGGEKDDLLQKIIKTHEGGYIFISNSKTINAIDTWVVKIDTSGNSIWDKFFIVKYYNAVNLITRTNNNDYFLTGKVSSFNGFKAWVMKIDENGLKKWRKIFNGNSIGEIKSFTHTIDNDLIIIGAGKLNIIKLDTHGNIIWEKYINGNINSIIQFNNKSFIISNLKKPWLMLTNMDNSGNIISGKMLKYSLNSSLLKTDDAGFILAEVGINNALLKEPEFLRLIKFKGNYGEVVKSYIDTEYIKWLQKSKYEKASDYKSRISNENKKIKKEQLKISIISKMASIKWNEVKNSATIKYDAESENFKIDYGSLGVIYINISIAEAEQFEKNFNNAKYFNTKFAFDGEKLFLLNTSIQNPENRKLYEYSVASKTVFKSKEIETHKKIEGIGYVINETDKSVASTDKTAPKIEITEPNLTNNRSFKRVNKNTKFITIKGIASDLYGISELKINKKGAFVSDEGEFFANVELVEGDNVIEFEASDIFGNKTKIDYNIHRGNYKVVTQKEENLEQSGQYHALIIGVSEYEDPNIVDLGDEPINDARNLADVLMNKYTFESKNISILESPKREDIIRKFDELNNNLNSSDNLLIFYAGHGYYDSKDEIGYWLPSDAEMDYTSKWIYNNVIVANIKRINTKHTLLISDACFSGSIFKTRKLSKDAGIAYNKKYDLKSRNALTSGTLKTVPNKSVFMKYLLDRLANNKQKYLSASELFLEIEVPVSNNSPNLPQFGDIRNVGDEGGDFIFIKRD